MGKLRQVVIIVRTPVNLANSSFESTPQANVDLDAVDCAPNRAAAARLQLSASNAAVSDLINLPREFFYSLADQLFYENQHWLPVLDRNDIQRSLDELLDLVDYIPDVVLRAVIALRIAYSSQAISLGYTGRRRLSFHLRSQVLMESMANPTLKSAQALHITALLDYGSDEIPGTLGIMTVVRRMGETIGLFRRLLTMIADQSPAQLVPIANEPYINDSVSVALAWVIISFDTVSTLGVLWRDAPSAMFDHLSGIAYPDVPDSRDSFRTHVHLAAIGLQPVHELIHRGLCERRASDSAGSNLKADGWVVRQHGPICPKGHLLQVSPHLRMEISTSCSQGSSPMRPSSSSINVSCSTNKGTPSWPVKDVSPLTTNSLASYATSATPDIEVNSPTFCAFPIRRRAGQKSFC